MYAWTRITNGGKANKIPVAGGRGERYVVESRNVVSEGSEVTQADIGVDDAQWQEWIDRGVLRSYPKPEGTDDYTSASQAFVAGVASGGEFDIDKLMEMGLTNPAEGGFAPSEEETPSAVPEGA